MFLTHAELNIFQKSKEEKKAKKKKHKHEDKRADLEAQADDLGVQPEETNEAAALPASTSAEVHTWLSPASWGGLHLI